MKRLESPPSAQRLVAQVTAEIVLVTPDPVDHRRYGPALSAPRRNSPQFKPITCVGPGSVAASDKDHCAARR